ncbi:hypothetical protein [Sulfurimonas sp.]|uniref:hypothetical protein n=1 Tax=Sulfurimonas sp. TaxID=2022749 RepID=UPI0019F45FF4|nr:hypothetical protein [Sulfurimonas sp.]MBE0515169.1 hypothetical protein [Sulfurimonas sp.]
MKRIILGLSVLLILVQNGLAKSDAEWDKLIANTSDEYWKQSHKCDKEALNHMRTGNVNECLKSIELQKKNPNGKLNIAITYGNTGLLYDESVGDKLKAYMYYMKAAKLGNTGAQKNLSLMCKQDPWACK